MVTHFSTNGLDSACGRSSQTLVSTAVTTDVSCKSCQRSLGKPEAAGAAKNKTPSLAELRKTAKAQVTVEKVPVAGMTKPAGKAVGEPTVATQPVRSGGFSVKAAYAARLAEQAGRSRLPRGKAGKQRHV